MTSADLLKACAQALAQRVAAVVATAGETPTPSESPVFSQKLPTPSESPLFSQKLPTPSENLFSAPTHPAATARPIWQLGDEFEQLSAFACFASVIIAQNTKWANAKKALDNLAAAGVCELEQLAAMSAEELADLIKPSGFYKTKARRLGDLARAVLADFGGFEAFAASASREWLLSQRGLGFESADSMFCYVCGRAAMIVDAATLALLGECGYEFEHYDEAAEWLRSGLDEGSYEALGLLADGSDGGELELFKRAHAVFLNFYKEFFKGKKPTPEAAQIFATLRDI